MCANDSTPLPLAPQGLTALAQEFYERRQEFGLTDSEIDGGVSVRRWPSIGPPTSEIEGRGDGQASLQEIFQAAFRRLEEISSRSSLISHSLRSFSSLSPWLLDDGDPGTREDAEVRGRIDTIARQARERSTPLETTQYLLNSLGLSSIQGGLAVHYNPDRTQWRRNGVEAVQDGLGDCNALSFLLYALALRAGLNPVFIRVAGRRDPANETVEEMFHIAVAVRTDPSHPNRLIPVDPSTGTFIDKTYQWYPISQLEMAALHLRNVALYNFTDVSVQETLLLSALVMAPRDFEIQWDVARFYFNKKGDSNQARQHLREAERLNPRLRTVWEE